MHGFSFSFLSALLVLTAACTGKDGLLTEILETGPGSTAEASTDATDPSVTTGDAAACGDEPGFQASLAAWHDRLAESGPDYYYTAIGGPGGFDGDDHCDYRTLTAVTAGVVVERRFEVSLKIGDIECDDPWIEQGADIGSHTNLYAVPAVTMDGLYSACCDDAFNREPAEEYTPNLEVDDGGLIKSCYALVNSCGGEGCDTGPFGDGLFLETIAFGPPPATP